MIPAEGCQPSAGSNISRTGAENTLVLWLYIVLSAVRHLNCAQVLHYRTMRYWHMQFRRLIRSFCRSIGSQTALSQWLNGAIIISQAAQKLLNKVKTEFVNAVNGL